MEAKHILLFMHDKKLFVCNGDVIKDLYYYLQGELFSFSGQLMNLLSTKKLIPS